MVLQTKARICLANLFSFPSVQSQWVCSNNRCRICKRKAVRYQGADIRKDQAVYPAADLVVMMPDDLEGGDFIGKYVLKKDMKPLKRGVYYVWVAKEGNTWKSRLRNSLGEGVAEGTVRVERMSSSTKSLTEPLAKIVKRQTAAAAPATRPGDCSFCIEHWCLHVEWPF